MSSRNVQTIRSCLQWFRSNLENGEREFWWLCEHFTEKSEDELIFKAKKALQARLSGANNHATLPVNPPLSSKQPKPPLRFSTMKFEDAYLKDFFANEEQFSAFCQGAQKRIETNMPLQYILGDVTFCNLSLKTEFPVLIPRPETEQIVGWLVHYLRSFEQFTTLGDVSRDLLITSPHSSKNGKSAQFLDFNNPEESENLTTSSQPRSLFVFQYPIHDFQFEWLDAVYPPSWDSFTSVLNGGSDLCRPQTLRILDVCTGSGNIALSLSAHLPNTQVLGVDLAPHALALSRKNQRQPSVATTAAYTNANFALVDVFTDTVVPRTQVATDRDEIMGILDTPFLLPLPKGGLETPTCRGDNLEKEHNLDSMVDSERFKFDILISNPPYIPLDEYLSLDSSVTQWEDKNALVPNIPQSTCPKDRQKPTFHASRVENTTESANTSNAHEQSKSEENTANSSSFHRPTQSHRDEFLTSLSWPAPSTVQELAIQFYERLALISTKIVRRTSTSPLTPSLAYTSPTIKALEYEYDNNIRANSAAQASNLGWEGVKGNTNDKRNSLKTILFPRVVYEIGGEDQSVPVCDMLTLTGYDAHIFKDSYGKQRWIVGFSRENKRS